MAHDTADDFTHLGYSEKVLDTLKSKREMPFFATVKEDTDRNALIREWQARVFTQVVPYGEEHLYRLPIALKNFALSKIMQSDGHLDTFSGVIYPSISMWLLNDNVAIMPSEVDSKLALFEVILLTLDSVIECAKEDGSLETKMALKPYDFARSTSDGDLIWGQKSQVIFPHGVDASLTTPQLLLPE